MSETLPVKHRIELPRRFYEDHMERCAERHAGRLLNEQKWKSSTVVVEADDDALTEIESDADYWGTMRPSDTEREYFGLIRSASAALKRIRAYRAARLSK